MNLLTSMAGEDDLAIISGEKGVTWKNLQERVYRLANGLYDDLGIRKRDKVAYMLYNSNEFLEVLIGASILGCPAPMINWHLKGDELEYVIGKLESKAETLILDRDFLKNVVDIRDRLENIKNYIVVGEKAPDGMILYEDLLKRSSSAKPKECYSFVGLELFTAGTTGLPKTLNWAENISSYLFGKLPWGPAHSFKEIRKSNPVAPINMRYMLERYLIPIMKTAGLLDWDKKADVGIVTAPLYHAGAIIGFIPLLFGGTLVMMKKFDAEEFLRLVDKEKATFSFVAPILLQRILKLPEEVKEKYDLSSFRAFVCAAAPCPPEVKKSINELFTRQGAPGPVFHEYYGSSDGGYVTTLAPRDYLADPKKYESVGVILPNQVKILDENGRECLPGVIGAVHECGNLSMMSTFPGALDRYEGLFKEIDGELCWVDEGLLGYRDEDNFLYLVGRTKDIIISGGVNIYPDEIENVILKHPKVVDAAVIGVPDKEWGESVKACVQLKEGETATEEEIIGYCNKYLSGYKRPKSVDFFDELPRHTDGKIIKRKLKDEYWKGIERHG